ncbi:ROK family protein [Nocardia sp. NPDC055049]
MSDTTPVPASQLGMRRQNLALVLRLVAAHTPISRATVAARSGLTRAAVSSLVDELITTGLVREGPATTSGRAGRPGRILAMNDRGPAGLGIEVGVGHLAVCVVDLRGDIRVRRRVEVDNARCEPAITLTALARLTDEACTEAATLDLRPLPPVLAVPGLLADRSGTVVHAPNLGWHNVPTTRLWPGTALARVDNEANLGAMAELWTGHAATDFLHVSAEVGIGAALVVDGHLHTGSRGYAGELGHVPIHPEGPPCTCGARGCLEQYASQDAVLRAAELTERARDTDPITLLTERAAAGDIATLQAIRRAGDALGIALVTAISLVDPAAVVLGGAYAELAPWLLPHIRNQLRSRLTVRPFDTEAITASALGRGGPVLGAALTGIQRILAAPGTFDAEQPSPETMP